MTEQQPPPRRFWLAGRRAAEQDRFFREALEARGWEEGDAQQWDSAWVTGMPEPAQFRNASPRRRINHVPGNAALTVKSRLHESLANLRTRMAEGFGAQHPLTSRLDFFPRAYVMPHDYHALQQAARGNPAQRWILKPTNASKGKGVRVLRDVGEAPLAPDWLVQEYLDQPHTIRGHKYVLRLYVLIASLAPLRVYLYRQGFAKLASEPWDPDDADNPYSQLTNPDINALNTRAEVPVEFIDLDRYRAWLREQGHDDAALFARIEELVSLTAIAGVDAMRSRTAALGADPRGCYELLGLDCLIDDTLKPWILECNLSPSLGTCAAPESGGLIEEGIKGDLVRDLIALTGLADGDAAEAPDPLAEAEAELARAGGFQRLLPAADPERYLAYFPLPTPEDLALADGLAGRRVPRPKLMRRRVSEVYDDQQLALYDAESGRLYRPNDTAALIWLLATEGLEPEVIVEALGAATAEAEDAPGAESLRGEVGSTLAEWCRLGLLCQRGDEGIALPEHDAAAGAPSANDEAGQTVLLAHEQRRWALEVADVAAMEHLQAGFGDGLLPLSAEAARELPRLALLKAAAGYALASDDTLIASRLTLPAIVPALTEFLLRQAAGPGQPVIDAHLVVTPAGSVALCVAGEPQAREALAALPSALRSRFSRGVRLTAEGEEVRLEPLGLPGPGAGWSEAEALPMLPRELPVWVMAGTESAPATPTPLSRLDALGVLLPGCRTAGGVPPSAETIQQLDRWLEGRACWTVGVESTLTQLDVSQPTPADSMAAGN
ncbi:amylase [Billgrantia sulfidoxydans]|uniref:Amylase n=1 Tax=Billgrantia sulfidoxydans TaxID=2733484 RepID=A0ABX7W6U7_9GAMM|nr:PqqD family peptide modification chaperone [Halomonas sulfidoxydans]QTP55996.1 amylase [Halomonas sulfidoxydans]